ncbi:MAG: hypothetical protein ACREIP_11680 [Alphaproteobacteria bacterium]
MLNLRFETWSVTFPEEWSHDIEDDILAIATPASDSVLQIGSMSKDEGAVDESDLWEFMEDAGVETSDIARVRLGEFEGLAATTEDDGVMLRYWVLRARDVLLLATFRCPAERPDADIAAVETVLKSLRREEAPAAATRTH